MKAKIIVALLLVALTVGCAPSIAPTEESPILVATEESLSTAQPEIVPQPELPASTATVWRAVRDPRYGFGLAIPCWWQTNPISADGSEGVQTIKNYDEAYFMANSTKGFWDWPNGTLKLDVIIMEGIEPANSDIDGYLQFSDPTMESVATVESQQFGSHNATIVTLTNVDNPNGSNTKVFIFRLAPDKLLMVNPVPQSIIDTPDFQAFLASIVLTSDKQIILPTITPAPALIDASCAQ